VHNVIDVRHIEVLTAEPLLPCPSHLDVEIDIGKLGKYKMPGNDQILAELFQAGETVLYAIHSLTNSIWNKEELLDQWMESIIVPIYERGYKFDCIDYCGLLLLSTSYKVLSNILLSVSSPYIDEIISVGFNITDQ
jgi:hypothetical protein